MKINKISSKTENKRKISDNFLLNIYYFAAFYGLNILYIAIACIMICIILIGAEILYPKYIQLTNFSLTKKTFNTLKENHKYHAAILLMENKESFMTDSEDATIYSMELIDCYIHTGQYTKAEKILLNMYENVFVNEVTRNKALNDSNQDIIPIAVDFIKVNIAMQLYELYSITGDIHSQKKYFNIVSDFINSDIIRKADEMYKNMEDYDEIKISFLQFERKYHVMSAEMEYFSFPEQSIKKLENIVSNIYKDKTINPGYKIKLLNKLISWLLDQKQLLNAYKYISDAVDLAYEMYDLRHAEEFGKVAEYCFIVHDYDNGQRILKLYQKHLDKLYDVSDIKHILGKIQYCKYLESQGKYEEISRILVECCTHLKGQINSNFTGMDEEQREFFINTLKEPFEYSIKILYKYPTKELAKLCFDNHIFNKGLLLRSNIQFKNVISNSSDSLIIKKFDDLNNMKRELVLREHISGPGNKFRIEQLQSRIAAIDKELSINCSEFKEYRKREIFSAAEISDLLSSNSCLVEFGSSVIDNTEKLYAFVINGSALINNIQFITLGDADNLISKLEQSIENIYSDTSITHMIWNKLKINHPKDIYYGVNGIFNQIAVPALSYNYGDNIHLCDMYDFHLISHPMEISRYGSTIHLSENSNVSIWGGINYSEKPYVSPLKNTFITRGDSLYVLPYSELEAYSINRLLSYANIPTVLYTGDDATKQSFIGRSNQNNTIIHISTHGFFNEDKLHRRLTDPMYNSGLFFAGANKYWINDSLYVKADTPITDDGILRAKEISLLNFLDCKLAILSACETGLGNSISSEGVYGLQRAFKLAGVESIIMSLWDVSDQHTYEFMKILYESLLSGKSLQCAYQDAVTKMRSSYPNPRYWAAFQLLK